MSDESADEDLIAARKIHLATIGKRAAASMPPNMANTWTNTIRLLALRCAAAESRPPSSTEGADPFAAVRALPEWQEVVAYRALAVAAEDNSAAEDTALANLGAATADLVDLIDPLVAAVEGVEG